MKICIKCNTQKPLVNFYRNCGGMKDGRLNTCDECFKLLRKRNYKKEQKRLREKYGKYGIGVGTIVRYGLKLALKVYDRAERKCQTCKEENDLTIHHKDRNGRNNLNRGLKQNNDVDNLIVLCRRCHGSIHGKQGKGIPKTFKERRN